jgi:hypothetical protein
MATVSFSEFLSFGKEFVEEVVGKEISEFVFSFFDIGKELSNNNTEASNFFSEIFSYLNMKSIPKGGEFDKNYEGIQIAEVIVSASKTGWFFNGFKTYFSTKILSSLQSLLLLL